MRMRRECGNVFPVTAGKWSRHASRHVRDARTVMHAGIANWRFPLKSATGENVPGIPGACATRNFTYLIRGPFLSVMTRYRIFIRYSCFLYLACYIDFFLRYIFLSVWSSCPGKVGHFGIDWLIVQPVLNINLLKHLKLLLCRQDISSHVDILLFSVRPKLSKLWCIKWTYANLAPVSLNCHYSNVILSAMASRLFAQPSVQWQIKENIKAPLHWPLWGEGPVTRKMFHFMTSSWWYLLSFRSRLASWNIVLIFMPIWSKLLPILWWYYPT